MDVLAVGDQAADDARIGEHRADDARRAGIELAHRVEEVGDRPRAGVERGPRLLGRRLRVAEADDDPGRGQALDERERTEAGASVTTIAPASRRDQRVARRVSRIGRIHCGGCTPLRRGR